MTQLTRPQMKIRLSRRMEPQWLLVRRIRVPASSLGSGPSETLRLTGRPWFRRRRIGVGWRPITWQGWLFTVLAVALAVGALTSLQGSSARVPVVILIVAAYAAVALATGGARRGEAAAPEDPPTGDEAETGVGGAEQRLALRALTSGRTRSEERRVGKECRSR